MMGEFGRTPRFNSNGGRDHWPRCFSVVLAGGGVAAGRCTARRTASRRRWNANPVSPGDLLATVYHLLGIDPHRH